MSDKWKTIPNGGFPNIYKLKTTIEPTEEIEKKKREKAGNNLKIVSIKDILVKKRHVNPFLNLEEENK
jgi:hypothetical protein